MTAARYRAVLDYLADLETLGSSDAFLECAIRQIHRVVPYDVNAHLVTVAPIKWKMSSGCPVTIDIINDFDQHYSHIVPQGATAREIGISSITSWRRWEKSEYVADFIRPQAIRSSSCILLTDRHGCPIHCLGVHRGGTGSFNDQDAEVLEMLAVHVGNLHRLLCRVETLEHEVPTPAEISGRYPPLSCREVEVAALLCRRLTFRQIATRLGIGVRTVETHVQHIYWKLDVYRRRDAVRVLLHRDSTGMRPE